MFSGQSAIPGLIDLHVHVCWGTASLGIDGEHFARLNAGRLRAQRDLLGRSTAASAASRPGLRFPEVPSFSRARPASEPTGPAHEHAYVCEQEEVS